MPLLADYRDNKSKSSKFGVDCILQYFHEITKSDLPHGILKSSVPCSLPSNKTGVKGFVKLVT